MSYAPITDFLALLRQTPTGAVFARAPGLDIVLSTLSRAGMFKLWVGQNAPLANQNSTAWLQPAQPSWTAEGVLRLWDSVAQAYVTATPALWFGLLSAGEGSIFDAISPTTTQGDMIVRGPTTNQRLPIGPQGSYLGSNGVLPEWDTFNVFSYDTRALAAAATIPPGALHVVISREDVGFPLCNAPYKPGTIAGPRAFQEAGGHWWELDLTSGEYNIRWGGAGGGNAALDVAAWTLATQLVGGVVNGVNMGAFIKIPAGTPTDLSNGSFLFAKSGTRILFEDRRTSPIRYDPVFPGTLFTFYNAGDLTGGISNCEMSRARIFSTNNVQKTAIRFANVSYFALDKVFISGFASAAGNSIGILNEGRNWLTVTESDIAADNPHFIALNPDRANYGSEDADFTTFERTQLTCTNAANAIHTVSDGCQVTSWTNRDCDWAAGRYGVLNIDATGAFTCNDWTFEDCRREQEQGAAPTMFAILRSGSILRNLNVKNAGTGNTLFNLSGVERAHFENPTVFFAGVNFGTADATVADLGWSGAYCDVSCTIALAGQLLVEGQETLGGTNAAPIYRKARYTNTPGGLITWFGAPSLNGRRTGLWRGVADVPVFTGANQYSLLPWSLYTVQYAEIRVNSTPLNANGAAAFTKGQVAPAGCTVVNGQANFAVDAAAGHLSVFHFTDASVGIVNKLAGSVPVTVEVLFTI